MATNVSLPAACPSCAAGGIRSSVKLYQINLEEAAVLCENASCPFPLFSQDICPLVVSHVAAPIPAANSKFKTRSMDTESITSSCSVSSWASHGSTISSLSSNVATPPPSISSKPFTWPSSQYSVYQPKAMAPKQNNIFDWITPISSSQSSPASSIFSVNDREVEMVMDKSACPTPNSGLTPSPSPTLSDILEAVGSQPPDSNDSYIESLCSFFDEVSEAPTPTINLSANEETTYTLTELGSRQSATVTDLLPTQQLQETATPVRQSTKRVNEGSDLEESNSKSLDSTSSSVAAWKNIELPRKKSSVISKKPQIPRVRKPRARSSLTSSDESTSSSTPTPQPLISQPQVAVSVNDEGTPVFTIHSLALPATPRPTSSATKVKVTDRRSRGRASKTSNPPSAATVKPIEKRTKKDAFCVQSLVNKFILAAKNKKLPESKAP